METAIISTIAKGSGLGIDIATLAVLMVYGFVGFFHIKETKRQVEQNTKSIINRLDSMMDRLIESEKKVVELSTRAIKWDEDIDKISKRLDNHENVLIKK